ncbi:MAG TPA: AAA family ATPase [Solirubrobacteraceae bacterium]|nr:AAA family ATPase [Solirubrobacteraceae bacterium]
MSTTDEPDEQPTWDEIQAVMREPKIEVWNQFRQAGGTDLLAIDTSKPIEWVKGAERIIRSRERQSWIASQGEGKTQAAIHLAVQVCAAGGRVIYVDVENDPTEMASRFQSVVASLGAESDVRERFSYLPDLNFKTIHGSTDHMALWAQALIVSDLLVIDSLARVLAMCGYDENSNPDFADFMGTYIDPIAKHGGGAAILMLDNVGHEGSHARGAINKAALVEAVYRVSGGKDVKPDKHGLLSLKLERSRSGLVADYVRAEAGDGHYGPLEAQDGSPPKSGAGEAALKRRQEIAAWMHEHSDEDFTVQGVKSGFGTTATTNTIRADLEHLVASGDLQRTRLDDKKANWWRSRGAAHLSTNPGSREPGG